MKDSCFAMEEERTKGQSSNKILNFFLKAVLQCLSGFGLCVRIAGAGLVATVFVWVIFQLPFEIAFRYFGKNETIEIIAQVFFWIGLVVWFGVFRYCFNDTSLRVQLYRRFKAPWKFRSFKEKMTRREFLQGELTDSENESKFDR